MRWKMSQGKRDIQPNLAWRRTRFESHYPPAASFLQRQCRHRGSSSLSEPDSRFEILDRDEMAEEEIQEEKEEEVQEEKDEENAGPEEKDGDDKEEDEVRTSDAQKHTPPLRRRPRRSHDIRDGRGERTGVLRRGGKARPFPIRSSASAANICRTPCLIRTCLFFLGGGSSANTQDQRMCVCVWLLTRDQRRRGQEEEEQEEEARARARARVRTAQEWRRRCAPISKGFIPYSVSDYLLLDTVCFPPLVWAPDDFSDARGAG